MLEICEHGASTERRGCGGSRALLILARGLRVAGAADAPIGFDQQIRPILSNNCFACHGPDAKARKASLLT